MTAVDGTSSEVDDGIESEQEEEEQSIQETFTEDKSVDSKSQMTILPKLRKSVVLEVEDNALIERANSILPK